MGIADLPRTKTQTIATETEYPGLRISLLREWTNDYFHSNSQVWLTSNLEKDIVRYHRTLENYHVSLTANVLENVKDARSDVQGAYFQN